MRDGRGHTEVALLPAESVRADRRDERERITPELALVCPELRELARERLPERDPDAVLAVPERVPLTAAMAARSRLSTARALRREGPLGLRRRVLVGLGLAGALVLASAALTFAQIGPRDSITTAAVSPARATELVVPDVRRQPYVFAKSLLADAGFRWRVEGEVEGYAGHVVATQIPGPGTRVVVGDDAPTVVLVLDRNPGYEERGIPQNASG